MLSNQLAAIGSDAAIPAMIDEIVAAAQGSDADRAELRAYAASRLADIRDLATHLDTPEDGADLYRTMAALWMELRFEFEVLAQYALDLLMQAQPGAVLKAAA
ncbi:MAG: hypothetical protein MUF40_08065 [Gemmatimonadaceae bacterium]|nr:hypothetical protein [Gemmatimonadaceae bacterium]